MAIITCVLNYMYIFGEGCMGWDSSRLCTPGYSKHTKYVSKCQTAP